MVRFHEVQALRRWWLSAMLLIPLAITGYGLFQQIILRRPWGNRPVSDLTFVLIEGALAAFVVWIHLIRLVTEVRDDTLIVRYVCLWPVRRIPLTDISSARDITYSPILDYGGWGVRWGWDGSMIFNVSGDRGVELLLKNGKRIVVGSQRSSELAQVIAPRLERAG